MGSNIHETVIFDVISRILDLGELTWSLGDCVFFWYAQF